jgi:ribosomal protein L10
MFINKAKLKKNIETEKLENLQLSKKFIGFFCLQNLSVTQKIQLKKDLSNQGFHFNVVKNVSIFKTLLKSTLEMKGIFSGTIGICYEKEKNNQKFNFLNLKKVFSLLKKNKDIFFLGGFFKGNLVNRLFEQKICSLTDLKSVQLQQISLFQSIINNTIITTNLPKNELSFLLSNKKD